LCKQILTRDTTDTKTWKTTRGQQQDEAQRGLHSRTD
jgi:hypothetical protein